LTFLAVMALASAITLQFEKDFNVKVYTTYSTEKTTQNRSASCNLNTNHITININHFTSIPLRHQKELIYHELGHCTLNLKHANKTSIMRPLMYSTKENSRNWPELLREMKKRTLIKKYKYKHRGN